MFTQFNAVVEGRQVIDAIQRQVTLLDGGQMGEHCVVDDTGTALHPPGGA